MVYTERAETAAVSRGTSHVSAKYTILVDIQNRTIKTSHSRRITCERSESARKRRTALYKSDQYQPVDLIVQELCESRGGRPGLSVLTSLLVFVDVKLY